MDAALLARIDPSVGQKLPNGQLNCLICNAPVKNAKLWTGHVNGRGHRENLQKRKNPSQAGTEGKKVSVATTTTPVAPRKHKIPVEEVLNTQSDAEEFRQPAAKLRREDVNRLIEESDDVVAKTVTNVPSLEESTPTTTPWHSGTEVKSTPPVEESVANESLPEGFFDDPSKDAKARNVEPKDPLEEEYNRFRKALVEEEHHSEVIVEEEEIQRQLEREIDEIDRQMSQWSRVHQLEERKDQIRGAFGSVATVPEKPENSIDVDVDEDEDIDIDYIVDWRNKLI